jgi:hypothetical protein
MEIKKKQFYASNFVLVYIIIICYLKVLFHFLEGGEIQILWQKSSM